MTVGNKLTNTNRKQPQALKRERGKPGICPSGFLSKGIQNKKAIVKK
jgi:hypothetical protein